MLSHAIMCTYANYARRITQLYYNAGDRQCQPRILDVFANHPSYLTRRRADQPLRSWQCVITLEEECVLNTQLSAVESQVSMPYTIPLVPRCRSGEMPRHDDDCWRT